MFRRCIAPLSYQYPLNASIVKLKKDAFAPEIKELSWLLADKVLETYKAKSIPGILIPMPLHWLKVVQRGFNQSHLIADILATRIPRCNVRNDICYRKKHRTDQHLSSKKQRWQLLANSFAVRHQSQIKGRRVALIDDVVTTGASATAVTNCLLSMGVKSVDIWCIARTGWHNTPS